MDNCKSIRSIEKKPCDKPILIKTLEDNFILLRKHFILNILDPNALKKKE